MNMLLYYMLCLNILFFNVNSQKLKRVKRIVGGVASGIPPEDDPVVFVQRDNRYAEIYGLSDDKEKFYVFKGIRYGMPPFGQHRFQRPKEMPLEGEIRAIKWGPPCPQPNDDGVVIGHEDCLFLNIFTPLLPESEETKYPVLVWIHGGGFKRGSASQYEMKNLVKKNLIIVSIQYRLGTLGFISSGTQDLPGNNGIFDMMLAIKWVKKYIEFFGGDTSKIVAFGHETGASSAMMLGLSKLTQDDLYGLIAMSGSSLSNYAVDKDPKNTAKRIAEANNCPTEDIVEMVRCLREVPMEKLVNVDLEIESKMKYEGFVSSITDIQGVRPVIEGENDNRTLPNFTTDSPENSLSLGDVPKIPLLTGVMKEEAEGAVLGDHFQDLSNKLAYDPEFCKRHLIPKLQKTVPIFNNIKKYFVPDAFTKYLNFGDDSKPTLRSVAKSVGDSLFNVPAFLTAKHWAKKAKTIMYSFDHKGRRKLGSKFLSQSPFTNHQNVQGVTGHGDELGYIFDNPNTVTGDKIYTNETMNKEDEEVMEYFTDMVAQFARTGDYSLPKESKPVTAFNTNTNNYVSISKKPVAETNFRYCEMGLWTSDLQRLQSPFCNTLRTTLETVNTVTVAPVKAIEKIDDKLEKTVGGLPGILTPGKKKTDSRTETTTERRGLKIVPQIGKYLNFRN